MTLPFLQTRYWRGSSFAAAPGAPPPSSAVTRQDDLVHWWKFDETSGTTSVDSINPTDSNLEMTLTNATLDSSGMNGYCALFDGTSDYAGTVNGAVTDVDKDDPYTLCGWIRQNAAQSGLKVMFGLGLSPTNVGQNGPWFTTNTNKVRGYHSDASSWRDVTTSGAIDAEAWYFVAMTWDGSTGTGNLKGYIGKVGTDSTISSTYDTANISSGGPAADPDSAFAGYGSYGYFNGRVDDFRFYNVELSIDEINDIYNGGDGDW